MTSRITAAFADLKKKGRAGLIPFIMAGDPDEATTLALLSALPEAGADIIEIGIPFSDPMADGPVIQAAGQRALKGGTTLKRILAIVMEFRKTNQVTPIILMGYYNPLYRFGAEAFCKAAAQAGADGLIIVDLPPEEEAEFRPQAEKNGLALIRLIAPTSVPARLPLLLSRARGFAYYISIAGITGAKAAEADGLKRNIAEIRKATILPLAVGFGIKTPAQAAEVARHADAVVVGSALVALCAEGGGTKAIVERVSGAVKLLAAALVR